MKKTKKNKSIADKTVSNPDPELVEELEDLLEQVIIEEASQAVWQQFEQALYQLDKQSLDVIESYLDGVPKEAVGKANKITPAQAGDMISQIKRDITRNLKKGSPVRH